MKSTKTTLPRKRPVKSRSVSDESIYWEIYNAIVEHRLLPGSKLGQDELGKLFGVSKTRVRPILHQLAQQKIVVIEPMRGAFVAKPSVEEAREVNVARQLLEDGIVREAARRITPADIEELKRNVEQEKDARLKGKTDEAHRLTGEFHMKVAEIAGNKIAAEVIRDLISRDSLVVAIYQKSHGVGCSLDAHQDLINAIASGDEVVAADCMKKHLVEIGNSLKPDTPAPGSGKLGKAFPNIKQK